MVRAATRGVLDFTRTDPLNPRWWQRTQWILDELQQQTYRESLKMQHAHWCSIAIATAAAGHSATEALNAATETISSYIASLSHQPAKAAEASETTPAQDLAERYREIFGSPGDPAYEQRVEEWLRHFGVKPETKAE